MVYAYDELSPFHGQAKQFLIDRMNTIHDNKPSICISHQACTEFIYSSTWQKLKNPLTLEQAGQIITYLLEFGIEVLYPKNTQLQTFLQLIKLHPSRKKLFDIAMAATLKDHNIKGIYTVNTKDFLDFEFLTVINPCTSD